MCSPKKLSLILFYSDKSNMMETSHLQYLFLPFLLFLLKVSFSKDSRSLLRYLLSVEDNRIWHFLRKPCHVCLALKGVLVRFYSHWVRAQARAATLVLPLGRTYSVLWPIHIHWDGYGFGTLSQGIPPHWSMVTVTLCRKFTLHHKDRFLSPNGYCSHF